MTAVKKASNATGPTASYKLAAALRRAKVAAAATPLEREIRPVAGKIRAVLNGKILSQDRQEALFGPGAIDIPEYKQARKTSR